MYRPNLSLEVVFVKEIVSSWKKSRQLMSKNYRSIKLINMVNKTVGIMSWDMQNSNTSFFLCSHFCFKVFLILCSLHFNRLYFDFSMKYWAFCKIRATTFNIYLNWTCKKTHCAELGESLRNLRRWFYVSYSSCSSA